MFGVILFSFLLESAGAMSLGTVVIGDILLVPVRGTPNYYQPLVYFTDGLQPPQYGSICYDGMTRTQPKVICNQLGYDLLDFNGVDYTNISYPVWLDDVYCDEAKNLQHILSCSYNVSFGYQTPTYPICSTRQYLSIQCNMNQPTSVQPFDGQILLCPPDHTNITTSSSFGLISMYLEKHKIWRGLNQRSKDNPMGLNEANAICQQLGYTTAVPGSALARSAVAPNFTFDKCYDKSGSIIVQKEAWLATDSINCTRSQECFTCCYDEYPQNDNCAECNYENDIVIQCTFDPTKLKPKDLSTQSPDTCRLSQQKCNGDVKVETTADKVAVVFSILELFIIFFLVVFIFIVWCCPCCQEKLSKWNYKSLRAEVTCCLTCDGDKGENTSLTQEK